MNGPLAGIRVVEAANWIAVPAAAALMADMGADVIKIEPPGGDSWRHFVVRENEIFDYEFSTSYPFQMDNRGKRSIALDLSKREAVEAVEKLVEKADVFLTNLVPRRLERYCLRYEDLLPLNPRLIYLAFNGYGPEGPEKDRLGFDISVFWARSGVMAQFREPGQNPVILPSAFGDHATSTILLSGILAALWERERTGKGQKISGSLLNSAIWALGSDLSCALVSRRNPTLYGRGERTTLGYNIYKTRDNRWFILVMGDKDEHWEKICKAVGREDLLADPRNGTESQRRERAGELRIELDKAIGSITLEEIWPRLDAQEIIWAPMQEEAEVVEDPQAKINKFFVTVEHPLHGTFQMINTPLKFSESVVGARGPAPEIGQHTESVLKELGYSRDQIDNLRRAKAIL